MAQIRRLVLASFFSLCTCTPGAFAQPPQSQPLPSRLGPFRFRVVVHGHVNGPLGADVYKVDSTDRTQSRSTAGLLRGVPGLSLRGNGALASIPMLHGLGDDRVKTVVNGMTVSNSCPNHMNPPLTYIAPSSVGSITVMAGVTPVSQGGDSLGGAVVMQSPPPVFAAAGKRLDTSGSASGFYRSNGQIYGGFVTGWIAGHHFGAGYTGTWSTGGDYTDGSGRTITSTYAESTDHTLTLAARGAGNQVVLRAGFHRAPHAARGQRAAPLRLQRHVADDDGYVWHGVHDGFE